MFLLAPMSLRCRSWAPGILVAATLFVFRMAEARSRADARRPSPSSASSRATVPIGAGGPSSSGSLKYDKPVLMVLEAKTGRSPLPGTLDPEARYLHGDRWVLSAWTSQTISIRSRSRVNSRRRSPCPATPVPPDAIRRFGRILEGSRPPRGGKELPRALKAVRLPKTGRPAIAPTPDDRARPPRVPASGGTAPSPGSWKSRSPSRSRSPPPATGEAGGRRPALMLPDADRHASRVRADAPRQGAAEKAAAEASAEPARSWRGLDELAKKRVLRLDLVVRDQVCRLNQVPPDGVAEGLAPDTHRLPGVRWRFPVVSVELLRSGGRLVARLEIAGDVDRRGQVTPPSVDSRYQMFQDTLVSAVSF